MPRKSRTPSKNRATKATTKSTPTSTITLQQSAWMHPTVRSWLISLRPWSFPASLGPVALAGALLHRPLSTKVYTLTASTAPPLPVVPLTTLLTPSFLLCFVVVLSFHAAANLFNTYYDFKSGTDTKESADDRGLVDGTVAPSTVFYSASALLSVGAAAASYLAYQCPSLMYVVVLPAASLCVLYTANPCSLKKYALGDVTIFLMFGPLLMSGVCAAATGVLLRHGKLHP